MTNIKMSMSPTPSHTGDLLQHGLQHIVQHNANSPYPDRYQDEGVHMQSSYGSPARGLDEAYSYQEQNPRYTYQQHGHQDSGLGIPFDGYGLDYQDPTYHSYGTPSTSPPTPQMHTRSGYAIPKAHQSLKPMPDGRSRVDKFPKTKKEKKLKTKAEKKVAKLEKPLSELTKDWKHVPVADIEAYVNRSAEERRKEVNEGKIPGKVKRPMNSFMLYRKAYQNRTKDWCLQNNHQVVSQVCGDSWPLEPDEVKEQFNEWARIERQNHQNAHPGYKFSPTKPGTLKGSSKRKVSEEESEESDLDDWEWQQGGSSRRSKRHRSSPRSQKSVVYPSTRSAYQYSSSRDTSLEPFHGGHNRSSFQANNPGRPIPPQYNQANLHRGEYYQQSIQPHPTIVGAEDVYLRKAMAPGVTSSYLGLPGGGEGYDLMQQYPPYESVMGPEYRIDPILITQEQVMYNGAGYSDDHPDGVYFGVSHNGDQQWQAAYTTIDRPHTSTNLSHLDPELDNVHIRDPHAHILKGNTEGWQTHTETLDEGGQFDKWMDE
ncbi:hypothetical protein B0O99DRAFT_674468 [Bisporella sp. PMI_857]|nr:hypothetical protein B0O99DRAFT_674468 [Bisporella sp. PMI_857]